MAIRQAQSEQFGRSVPGCEAEILLHPLRQGTGAFEMEELRGSSQFEHGHGRWIDVREKVFRREEQKRCKGLISA